MRNRWLGIPAAVALIAPAVDAGESPQDRNAIEAANQAVEADRLFKEGKFDQALPLYQAERASRAKLGDARYEAHALRGIACCLAKLGDLDGTATALRRAKALDLQRDDPGFAGYDSLLLARALNQMGKDDEAVKEIAEALSKFTSGEDRDHEAESRVLLARIHLDHGKVDASKTEIDRAIPIIDALDAPALQAEAFAIQGGIDAAEGRTGLAFERLLNAQERYRDAGSNPVEVARLHLEIADALARLGRLDRAESRLRSGVEELGELGDPRGRAEGAIALASLRLDRADPGGAAEAAGEALRAFREIGDPAGQVDALILRAEARDRSKRTRAALEDLNEAVEISARIHADDPSARVRVLLLAAEYASGSGRKDEAAKHAESARSVARSSGDAALIESVNARANRVAPGAKRPPG